MLLQEFLFPFGHRHIVFRFLTNENLWICPNVIEEIFYMPPGTFNFLWERHYQCLDSKLFAVSSDGTATVSFTMEPQDGVKYYRMVSEDVFAIILYSQPNAKEVALWYSQYVKRILKLSSKTLKTPRQLQQTVKAILDILAELLECNNKHLEIFSKPIPITFQFDGQYIQENMNLNLMYQNQQIRLLKLLNYATSTTEKTLSNTLYCALASYPAAFFQSKNQFPSNPQRQEPSLECHERMVESPKESIDLTESPASPVAQEYEKQDPVEIPTTSATGIVYNVAEVLDLSMKHHKDENVPVPTYSHNETDEVPTGSDDDSNFNTIPLQNKLKKFQITEVPFYERALVNIPVKKSPYIIVKVFQLEPEALVYKFMHCKRISVNTSLKRLKASHPRAHEVFTGRMLPKDGDILRIMYNHMANNKIPFKLARNNFTFEKIQDAAFMLALCNTMFETKKFY